MKELNAVGELVPKKKADPYARNRALYIIEALVEYLISLTITGTYIADLTKEIGMNTAMTGIITAFLSLGHCFQIFAIFLTGIKKVKPIAAVSRTINMSFFAFLYIVPMTSFGRGGKSIIFMALLLGGYIIASILQPCITNWYMSFVDTRQRGVFTAKKEIISLLGGMTYSFVLGVIYDHFYNNGDKTTAFIVCAVAIFSFTILHTCILLLTQPKIEKHDEHVAVTKPTKSKINIIELLSDKRFIAVVALYVLWNIANYCSTPFYGDYLNVELSFTKMLISIIGIVASLSRVFCSIPLGKYADKHSFTKMLSLVFTVAAVGFIVCGFATPSTGIVTYTLYSILHAVAMAGINSGSINLIYEYYSGENKTGALAFSFAVSGLFGFLSTLAISPLITYIQNNNNTFLGLNLYAQQVVSFIAAFIVILIIVYLNTVVKSLNKRKDQ